MMKKRLEKTLSEILSFENYKVDEAADGEEGLKKFKEGNYDVVLCDIKMPKIDGLEFLQKAVEANPEIENLFEIIFFIVSADNEKLAGDACSFTAYFLITGAAITQAFKKDYFFRYITSLANLTVRGTSGKAPATKLGA